MREKGDDYYFHNLLIIAIFCCFLIASGASNSLCNKWNAMLEPTIVPSLNVTSSLGLSAEGAARRVIEFVRENSTVLDIGGHLGIFSEAIISMYNDKFSNTSLNIGIFEPRRLLHLCQIERMALGDKKKERFLRPNRINVQFFNYALGEKEYGIETLYVTHTRS